MYLFKCSCIKLIFLLYKWLPLFSTLHIGLYMLASEYTATCPLLAGKRQQASVLYTQTVLTHLAETINCSQYKILQLYAVFLQHGGVMSKSSLLPHALKEREFYRHMGEVELESKLVCVVCHEHKGSNSNGTLIY